ncbi:phage integrase N-terminal SAM-like domain-containing protein [Methylovorus sp. SPW-M1]
MSRSQPRIRMMHYSIRTEKAYVNWVKRFIPFHNKAIPKPSRVNMW